MESEKDLIAYYPYLVYLMCSSKEDGGVIHLSEKSYIDIEEEESLTWKINILKKYYRKCKRYKISFDDQEALDLIRICDASSPKEYEIKLINKVKELGEQAIIDGIHDDWHDRMRKEWYDLMVEAGWEKSKAYRWVYGWNRYLEKYELERYGKYSVQKTLDNKHKLNIMENI